MIPSYRNLACATLLALLMLSTPSCALFSPDKESKTETAETGQDPKYLNAGPTTELDVSPGQMSLLESLRETKEEVATLRRERDELRNDLRKSQMRFSSVEAERNGAQSTRVSLAAELEDSLSKIRDRDARLLDAAIEKAKLEQKILELEIEAAKARIAANQAAAAGR